MTGQELLNASLALLNERREDGLPSEDLTDFCLNAKILINILIATAEQVDCAIKGVKFSPEMCGISQINSLNDEIPTHATIVKTAFVYGLAGMLVMEEDYDKAYLFWNRFLDAMEALRKRFLKYTHGEIVNIY